MTVLVIIISGLLSSLLGVALLRTEAVHKKFLLQFLYYGLLIFSSIVLFSEFLGVNWNGRAQVAAFVFVFCFFLLRISIAGFWGKIYNHCALFMLIVFGGYLYAAYQIPYPEIPYADVSSNQPMRIDPEAVELIPVSGIPLNSHLQSSWKQTKAGIASHPDKSLVDAHKNVTIPWSDLQPIIRGDSHIRSVLHDLKERQEQELSAFLSQLNSKSVSDTRMHRHALDRQNITELYQEKALSYTRYRTIVKTWKLLDLEEKAFREKQAEQRFHMLLLLLQDEKVDESYKVELIDFMVRMFPNDVRLIKPLIQIYHHLDTEYPRQKRFNRSVLDLYIAKRNAVLRGFTELGAAAKQPLLDYRKKTVSSVSYSQARLDYFIAQNYAYSVTNLYEQVQPKHIPQLLNRQKYPPIRRLRGASFEQDYVRRELIKVATENQPPEPGKPVMGLSQTHYDTLRQQIQQGYADELDYLIIHQDPVIRANLAWLLAELKEPYTLPLIFTLMGDFEPEVRRLAAMAAGNFKIRDMQGANDQKFIEIVRMLQNYRSNSDAYGRIWALMALADGGDKHKALYIIDLLLNDGKTTHSVQGAAAPTWRSEEERSVVQSFIETLQQTPEELAVKTAALNALLAIDSPETLGVLLHYLQNIYRQHHDRPSLWRYLIPHMSLPQAAENVEDLIFYLAATIDNSAYLQHKRHLKALNLYIRRAYEANASGQFFQNLTFLRSFDAEEYQRYLQANVEQIRIMRLWEYTQAGFRFWLIFLPISAVIMLVFMYGILPKLNLNLGGQGGNQPNRRANPASDKRNKVVPPPASIIPIKISSTQE